MCKKEKVQSTNNRVMHIILQNCQFCPLCFQDDAEKVLKKPLDNPKVQHLYSRFAEKNSQRVQKTYSKP